MIHGDDIYVLCNVGGSMAPVAAAKTGDLDISQDFIKACAPTEGRTFIKIPTTYDWSMSCDCLMTTDAYAKLILDAARDGTELTVQFTAFGWKVQGSAFVKSARIQTSKGGLAKLSISFESSGPLVDGEGWDFINGKLYTYSAVLPWIDNTGLLIMQGEVDENGVLKYKRSRPTPAMVPSES